MEQSTSQNITFITPPHGLKTHGIPYFSALSSQLTQQFPSHSISLTVDAGDDAGLALAALEAGFKHVSVTLTGDTLHKLQAIAEHYNAKVFDKAEYMI
jgi:hypothetical protein